MLTDRQQTRQTPSVGRQEIVGRSSFRRSATIKRRRRRGRRRTRRRRQRRRPRRIRG